MKLIDKDKFLNKYERFRRLPFFEELSIGIWYLVFINTLILTGNWWLALSVCVIVVAITTWLDIKYLKYLRKK